MKVPVGLCRRDYGRKLKFRSAKYQTQLESRSATMFSNGNEVDYIPKWESAEEMFGWAQHIRHYLSEDTTQDSTQAFYQMRHTMDWFKSKGVKAVIYIEDGARQQYTDFLFRFVFYN